MFICDGWLTDKQTLIEVCHLEGYAPENPRDLIIKGRILMKLTYDPVGDTRKLLMINESTGERAELSSVSNKAS